MPRGCLVTASLIWLACNIAAQTSRAADTAPTAADVEFFEKRIRPLLVDRCFECHADHGKGVKGGLHLDSRAGALAGGDSGPAIISEKPGESLLVEAISYGQDSTQMPPRGKLPQAEIGLLTEWVRRGAPFPASNRTAQAEKNRRGVDYEAGKK